MSVYEVVHERQAHSDGGSIRREEEYLIPETLAPLEMGRKEG